MLNLQKQFFNKKKTRYKFFIDTPFQQSNIFENWITQNINKVRHILKFSLEYFSFQVTSFHKLVKDSTKPYRRVKIAKKWPFGGKKKDSTEMYTNDTSGYVE